MCRRTHFRRRQRKGNGYEQALATAGFKAGMPVCIAPSQRPRHFAEALGIRAKNDPLLARADVPLRGETA